MKFTTWKSQQGMTFIEILIATAIGGVLVLLISGIVNYGILGQKGVDNMNNASEFSTEIKQLMWRQDLCTENMKTLFTSAIAEGQVQSIQRIYQIQRMANGTNNLLTGTAPLVEVGNATSGKRYGVAIDTFEFQIRKKVTDKFYIGAVFMSFNSESGLGAKSVVREFPIGVGVNSGNFAYCGALDSGVDGNSLNDKICEIATNGEDYWDGTECKSKYTYQTFPGTELDAECPVLPAGQVPWIPHVCNMQSSGGTLVAVPSKRQRGAPRNVSIDSGWINPSTGKCECDLANDATGTCIITCKRQTVF